jgi:hypothetical protein
VHVGITTPWYRVQRPARTNTIVQSSGTDFL